MWLFALVPDCAQIKKRGGAADSGRDRQAQAEIWGLRTQPMWGLQSKEPCPLSWFLIPVSRDSQLPSSAPGGPVFTMGPSERGLREGSRV